MATSNVSITTSWTLVKTGPTLLPLTISTPTIEIELSISNTTPLDTLVGGTLSKAKPYSVLLPLGQNLYARSKNGTITIVLDDGVGSISANSFFSDDIGLNISKGNVLGHSAEFKFARSNAITTTESVVWDGGGDYHWLTSAEKMSIVSTSTEDAVGGTGAITLIIIGLDADFAPIQETITLTGTTPVITDNEYLRIFRAIVLTSGTDSATTDANKGDITVTGNISTELVAKILIGNGQTLMSTYTVPAGKTAYLGAATFGAGEGKQCTFKAKLRNAPQASGGAFSVKYDIPIYESAFYAAFKTPFKIPEKSDTCFTAKTTVGTIDASVSYEMILVDN